MTWPNVAQAVADGTTTVILPLGATEQHGPLPLAFDTFRAAALAGRLALHLPMPWSRRHPIGCSDEHSGCRPVGPRSIPGRRDCGLPGAWRQCAGSLLSARRQWPGAGTDAKRLNEELLVAAVGSWFLDYCVRCSVAVAEAGISAEPWLHAGDGRRRKRACVPIWCAWLFRVTGSMAEVMPNSGSRPAPSADRTLGDAAAQTARVANVTWRSRLKVTAVVDAASRCFAARRPIRRNGYGDAHRRRVVPRAGDGSRLDRCGDRQIGGDALPSRRAINSSQVWSSFPEFDGRWRALFSLRPMVAAKQEEGSIVSASRSKRLPMRQLGCQVVSYGCGSLS
jgi:hypothetical protein